MKKEEFELKLQNYANEININLKKEQINQFYDYMNLLIEWNEKINLTAITNPDEIILKHFIDSMTVSSYITENAKLVDVGTGAGFPGIPLKIIRDDLDITLVDSLNKRILFLQKVIDTLKLKKIEAMHFRVEEFGRNKKYREKFDVVTSRAVANLSTLAEYQIPLLKVNGLCICMKAQEIDEEVEQSKNAVELLGGKIERIEKFQLPQSDIKRSVVLVKKVKNTSAKYPRKPGTPSKEPL